MTVTGDQLRIAYKNPCRVATTGNISDLGEGAPSTVDGVSVVQWDRVLVWQQSTASQNGIYIVETTGVWVRSADFDESNNDRITAGLEVYIQEGNTLGTNFYRLATTGSITLGVTNLTFEIVPELSVSGTDEQVVRINGTGILQNSPLKINDSGDLLMWGSQGILWGGGTTEISSDGTDLYLRTDSGSVGLTLYGTTGSLYAVGGSAPVLGGGWVALNMDANGAVQFGSVNSYIAGVSATDSMEFVGAAGGYLFDNHILPSATSKTLGSAANPWATLYLYDPSSINFGNGVFTLSFDNGTGHHLVCDSTVSEGPVIRPTNNDDGTLGTNTTSPAYFWKQVFGNLLTMTERSSDYSLNSAGEGTLWVKDDTPNTLYFTDGANNLHKLTGAGTLADNDEIIYVCKSGNDSYDGRNVDAPKLTLGSAITAASAQSPSSINRIEIRILGGGTYTENPSLPAYVSIDGPEAIISGYFASIGAGCRIRLHKISAGAQSAFPMTTSGDRYIDVDYAECTSGLIVGTTHATAVANVRIGEAVASASTAGVIYCSAGVIRGYIGRIYQGGAYDAINTSGTSGASVYLDVNWIQADSSGTGISHGSNGSVDINVRWLSATTTYEILNAAGYLRMFVNHISGSVGTLTGHEVVTIAGQQGDVYGPSSSIDNSIPRFDLTTGKIIQGGATSKNIILDDTGNLYPQISDGGGLGTATYKWADLFLASGSVIDFNGDVQITHSANQLTFSGATNGYRFENGIVAPVANNGAQLGSSTVAWSDLFLAEGGIAYFGSSVLNKIWGAGAATSGVLDIQGDYRIEFNLYQQATDTRVVILSYADPYSGVSIGGVSNKFCNISFNNNAVYIHAAEPGIAIRESATPPSHGTAGEGDFWVKNETPTAPWYTDDDGGSYRLPLFSASALTSRDMTPFMGFGSATNLLRDSQFIGNTYDHWVTYSATLTYGKTSPTGNSDATEVDWTSTGIGLRQSCDTTLAEDDPYTLTFWARNVDLSTPTIFFNIKDGTNTYVTLTNTWQRYEVVVTAGGSPGNDFDVESAYTGAIEVWGFQLEHDTLGNRSGPYRSTQNNSQAGEFTGFILPSRTMASKAIFFQDAYTYIRRGDVNPTGAPASSWPQDFVLQSDQVTHLISTGATIHIEAGGGGITLESSTGASTLVATGGGDVTSYFRDANTYIKTNGSGTIQVRGSGSVQLIDSASTSLQTHATGITILPGSSLCSILFGSAGSFISGHPTGDVTIHSYDDVIIANSSSVEYARFLGAERCLGIYGLNTTIGTPAAYIALEVGSDTGLTNFNTCSRFFNEASSGSYNHSVMQMHYPNRTSGIDDSEWFIVFTCGTQYTGGIKGATGSASFVITYETFAGSHAGQCPDSSIQNGEIYDGTTEWETGMILVSNGARMGANNQQPQVVLASALNAKTVVGIYLSSNPNAEEMRYADSDGDLPVASYGALGHCQVLVTNKGGDVDNGDLVTSSTIPGYGQKQADDIVHSYTVCKVNEQIDWSSVTNTIDEGEETYKYALVNCFVYCG